MTILAGVLVVVQLWAWAWDLWWRPAVLAVAGYGLQWIGHRIEGNTMGELIPVLRLMGKPHLMISPRNESFADSAPPVEEVESA